MEIVVMVGLPCSGKSTYIKEHYPDYVVVSSDDYVEMVARQTKCSYNDVFTTAMKDVNKFLDMVLSIAIQHNKNIIHDQTNMSSRKRKQILSKIPESYTKTCIVIKTPLSVIKKRNEQRSLDTGKYIPDLVIKGMISRYEDPSIEEGWVHIKYEGKY